MARRLIIVGFGGCGREVLAWVKQIEPLQSEWAFAGVLDFTADCVALPGYEDVPFLGNLDTFQPSPGDMFTIAIAEPRDRERRANMFLARGGSLCTLIHPTAIIGPNVTLGEGAIIYPYVVMTCDITAGRLLIANLGSTIGHDAVIGDFCTIYSHADITGRVRIGDATKVCSHASVLPKLRIGSDCTIGAGAIVVANVKSGNTVFGSPAKRLRLDP